MEGLATGDVIAGEGRGQVAAQRQEAATCILKLPGSCGMRPETGGHSLKDRRGSALIFCVSFGMACSSEANDACIRRAGRVSFLARPLTL